MIIDLRSDTVTRPTLAMKDAMMNAPLGDDVLGDDPTVSELENYAAKLLGKEAALFCPSGTMTNQIALALSCPPLSEVIIEEDSHVYQYEAGGIAFNARAQVKCLQGHQGKLRAEQITDYLLNSGTPNLHKADPAVVSLENTTNRGGGIAYRLEEIKAIQQAVAKAGLRFHLDGARLFNAIVATGEDLRSHGHPFDTISICLSKGLGAPVGSLLLARQKDIERARKLRKVMGGGMRQSGMLAAAGLYALKNNIERLQEDHGRAKILFDALKLKTSLVRKVFPSETNIVIFELLPHINPAQFLLELKAKNILASSFGGQLIRFVTHLDFTDAHLKHVLDFIQNK